MFTRISGFLIGGLSVFSGAFGCVLSLTIADGATRTDTGIDGLDITGQVIGGGLAAGTLGAIFADAIVSSQVLVAGILAGPFFVGLSGCFLGRVFSNLGNN